MAQNDIKVLKEQADGSLAETLLSPSVIGAVEDVASDGKSYVRKDKAWVEGETPFIVDGDGDLTPTDAIPFSNPYASLASQAEAEAGTDNAKWMTPLRTAQAIAAFVDTPYEITGFSGAVDTANGSLQKATFSTSKTLGVPTGGSEGSRLELWLKSTGSAQTLSLNAAILVPSDSAISFPKTLTQNKTYIVLLKYNGTAWMLVSLVGGY